MSLLKKIKDKTGTVHDIGDSRVDAYETELSGAEHNVPYSPAVLAKTNAIEEGVSEHVGNTANPHKVTKEQLGLSNVENKSSTQIRSELTKENVTNALGYTPIDESRIGAANGVASLDASGRIPASQIPGGFDNIEEYENLAGFPATGEEGKIYVAKDTNLTYRWTGTQYVEISPSLALGETATTAYRGDRGKAAYDHSQVSGNSTVHHVHENKELLDTYTQTEADLANAVAKVHEHGNKSVLDGITSDKVTSWDGKEDAFDILPLSKGGTGANNKKAAEYNIIGLTSIENDIGDDSKLALLNPNVSSSNGVIRWLKASYIWTYIKNKISSVLGLTATDYAGKAATAGTADKAVADNSGNDIEETYATKTELATKQNTLTFDTTPTKGSTNPVTSDGIRQLSPLSTRVDTITEDKLIYKSGNFSSTSIHADASYVFGLQYGDLMKLQFRSNISSTTTELKFKLLNAAVVYSNSVLGLRASVCTNPNGTYCFVIWLDHTAGMKTATYFSEYFPDMTNTYTNAKHLATFDKTQFTEVRNLNLSYQPVGLPTIPSNGTSVLQSANGVVSWNDGYATKSDFESHTGDTTVHITSAERKAWNAKQAALVFDDTPTAGSTNPVTSGGIKTAIDAVQSNIDDEAIARGNADVALQTKLNNHTGDTTVHITEDERTAWNAKQDALTAGNNVIIDGNTVSSDQLFVATYGTTSYSDVKSAYDAGKILICTNGNSVGFLYAVTETNIRFSSVNAVAKTNIAWMISTESVWTSETLNIQPKLAFDTEPKVASTNPVTSGGIKSAIDAETTARTNADETLQSNIDTVDAKGIVVKEIDGEQVICFE